MAWIPFGTRLSGDEHVAVIANPEDKPVKDVRGKPSGSGAPQRIPVKGIVYLPDTPEIGPEVKLIFDNPCVGEVAL